MDENLKKKTLEFLNIKDYRPLNKSELARAMSIDSKERAAFRHLLRDLEQEGTIIRLKKGRFQLAKADDRMATGRIRIDARGHGRVRPEGVASEEIFIHAKNKGTSLSGDLVLVERVSLDRDSLKINNLSEKRKRAVLLKREDADEARGPEGRVTKVLERKPRKIVGTFRQEGKYAHVVPDDHALPQTIELQGDFKGARVGFKVLVSLDQWENKRSIPRGTLLKVLGAPHTAGIDILSIIHRHGLPTEFPEEVLAEAEALSEDIPPEEIARREDWRNREILTIDPYDARDFDDAIGVTELDDGGWELAVHIADVSHYVPPGSALDREAHERGNSVYLVDRVLPMLPEKLCNGICSLKPDVERLTHAAIIRFDSEGDRVESRVVSAVIKSGRRFTYEEAHQRLMDPGPSAGEWETQLLVRAWSLASLLRKKRFANGGLELDFPEIKVKLDENGKPIEMVKVEYDESHQLIEEFMLSANEVCAEMTREHNKASIYRVHEAPDEERLIEYRELALEFGHEVGDLNDRDEIQKLLKKVRGLPEERTIKIGLLKSLKRAIYFHDPLGHYGLAKDDYTHFTSPIRRYCDLIVHRVVRALTEKRGGTPPEKFMEEAASHISSTERNAAECEMETVKLKQMEYFEALASQDEPPVFDAMIVDVSKMGMFVELTDYSIKGLIKRDEFLPNEYEFQPASMRYRGMNPKIDYRVGDPVRVEVAHVHMEKKLLDFRMCEPS